MRFSLDQTIELLGRTPGVVESLVEGLSDDWVAKDYGAGTWSVHDIIGHLIWGERTDWIPRMRLILEKSDSEKFAPFDRQGHLQLCASKTTNELVTMFVSERDASLNELSALNQNEINLDARGLHPALGSVTLRELLATWTVHDLNHIAQISKAMAYQYRQNVGPWEAYLSILAPPNPR